jgi:hypothetical protein
VPGAKPAPFPGFFEPSRAAAAFMVFDLPAGGSAQRPFRVIADGLNWRAAALSAASPSPSPAASCGAEASAAGQTSTPGSRVIADRAMDTAALGDSVETHALGALAQGRSLLRA